MKAEPVVTQVLTALTGAGTAWALLRDDAAEGADTDLLIAEQDLRHVMTLAAEHGFAPLRTWRHGPHRFLVAYDEAMDRWWKLDIVTRIVFRSGREMPEEVVPALLRRVSRDGDWARLAPDDEFWLLLLHGLLDKGGLEERHLVRLVELAEQLPHPSPGPAWKALRHAPHVHAGIVALVREQNATGLLARADELQAHLDRPGAMTRARLRAAGRLTPVLKAVLRPGLTVALLGPDGAGKSSLIAGVSGTFYLPTRAYYVGLYGAARPRRLLGFALPWQLARAWRAYLGGAYHRRRGRLVLFDRYGYDTLPRAGAGGSSVKSRLRRFLIGVLCPRPDLVVILDAPPTQLYARKQEHDVRALGAQRDGFLRLADRLRSKTHVEVIDASQSMDAVRRQMIATMWRRIASRRPPSGLPRRTTIESQT